MAPALVESQHAPASRWPNKRMKIVVRGEGRSSLPRWLLAVRDYGDERGTVSVEVFSDSIDHLETSGPNVKVFPEKPVFDRRRFVPILLERYGASVRVFPKRRTTNIPLCVSVTSVREDSTKA